MMRVTVSLALLLAGCAASMRAQSDSVARRHVGTPQATADDRLDDQRASFRRAIVRYGKWLTAGVTVGFIALAAHEHESSERQWDALLAICRTGEDACTRGPDGRYVRADAERLYQSSRAYDARATRRLVGAQASLLLTAALFILDLRPGEGPENIPYSSVEVTGGSLRDGAWVGVRVAF